MKELIRTHQTHFFVYLSLENDPNPAIKMEDPTTVTKPVARDRALTEWVSIPGFTFYIQRNSV